MELRKDFENMKDGQEVILHPNDNNPIHQSPVKAVFMNGYYYCEGTDPVDGPDYYFRDVSTYNHGFIDT